MDVKKPAVLGDGLANTVARRLGALSEPTRLRLAAELCVRDEAPVQDLATAVGSSVPNVSKHLQVMHQSGVVVRRKQGTHVRYRLANEHVGNLVRYAVKILGDVRHLRP